MKISSYDNETRRFLKQFSIDVSILGFMILLFLYLAFFVEPFHRGFFCDDKWLMHPYRESTVGLSLATVGFGLPILLITLMEFARSKFSEGDCASVKLFNRDIPFWALGVYKNVVVFLFGAYVDILITDIGKRVVGRLRPHFLEICQPVMGDGTNCSSPINFNRYIEDFTCGNAESSATQLREMRLSFPSGHSSLSMYTMVFAAYYLHYTMKWQGSRLLKHSIQTVLFAMAWFTALSRISDYKHHWSDVAGGTLLGIAVCLLTVYGVSDLAVKRGKEVATPVLPTTTDVTQP